jgi:hypothetical protein
LNEELGSADPRIRIGLVWRVSALLFPIPRISRLACLPLRSSMEVAHLTHTPHGQPPFLPLIILVSVWIGACFRHPAVVASFGGPLTPPTARQDALGRRVTID